MTVIESIHDARGATFADRGGRRVVADYGRPERAHLAVRNGVGCIEVGRGVVVVEGDDRVEYVDNVVSNRVPETEGSGCYAVVCDPQGRIELDLYVYNAGSRLLVFTPPGTAGPLVEDWREKIFIQDVEIRLATDEFGVFGVHGPQATEKVASVLNGASTPEDRLTFVRGSIGDAGVSVIRTDGLAGEESYEVVCAAADAESVYELLTMQGGSATPFGYRTWETLTLEAGTPLFATELEGTIPNVLGLRFALDFEKGCYVGQEVVSRVENRGQPSRCLIGLVVDPNGEVESAAGTGSTDWSDPGADAPTGPIPDAGAAVFAGDASVGEVTRAAHAPSVDASIAFALVEYDRADERFTVRIDGDEVPAERRELPFVEGSDRSARLPTYT
ncbi:aminomethyltransferase family protein [Halovivax limisalsi]|uniref:CAF17-like 4Fe-4S cluster assembly/insertion protein YgfZ n=1 Tax=Halovivax limisalsi TaxID=1453760 RepID=UPI001FFD33C7|nr:glycine cleavage T C-terminal barrel domain-containing protein [Halovivax limisalsi]